jgi:hypothetical protein
MMERSLVRLSAQRALLGRIYPEVRLIKTKLVDKTIFFQAFTDISPDSLALEALSDATGELLSDFPDYSLEEQVISSPGPLPKEDLVEEGWVYLRYNE